jgi:hypothetical protein
MSARCAALREEATLLVGESMDSFWMPLKDEFHDQGDEVKKE